MKVAERVVVSYEGNRKRVVVSHEGNEGNCWSALN